MKTNHFSCLIITFIAKHYLVHLFTKSFFKIAEKQLTCNYVFI